MNGERDYSFAILVRNLLILQIVVGVTGTIQNANRVDECGLEIPDGVKFHAGMAIGILQAYLCRVMDPQMSMGKQGPVDTKACFASILDNADAMGAIEHAMGVPG